MAHWGPDLAWVGVRRLSAEQLAAVGLADPAVPRCVVLLAVHSPRETGSGCPGEKVMPGHPRFCVDRSETYLCALGPNGAYGCPTNAEGGPPLRTVNAGTNAHGILTHDPPLAGTHPTPPLAWQRRYPKINGWIEPWTRTGRLRAGLVLAGTRRGPCFAGSMQTFTRDALACRTAGFDRFDPCFASKRSWRAGDIAACANAPGGTTFLHWVITRRV